MKRKFVQMAVAEGKSPYPRIRQVINDKRYKDDCVIDIQYAPEGNYYRYLLPEPLTRETELLMCKPSRSDIIRHVKAKAKRVNIYDTKGNYLKCIFPDKN